MTLLHLKDVAADRRADQASSGNGQDRRTGDAPVRQGPRAQGARAAGPTGRGSRRTPLPAIASLRDGGFLLLAKAADDKVLVQSPQTPRPALMTRAEFEAVWDGGLILMTRRAGLSDLTRRFDITWFLGAIHKYRHLLGEVLVASFFLQLFALVSPLFFQVVIDKVLVHRALSTLDVLVDRPAGDLGVRDRCSGILRTYLFSHTTNRIDVELGARLFRHLLALPIAYFQARRVGDSVARVRELENIRNFLTSSALTLVIDLFFTFVFLAVMFFYSPLLTWIVLGSFPFYIAISAGATPLFRRRLDEKFQRGAENQAFLVESVTGIETLKAMAVEPQMQRRWEEQLAGYVRRELPRAQPRQHGEPGGAARQQARHRGHPLFRRQAGDRRQPDGRRARRLQHAGRPGERAGAAAGADLAGFPPGAAVGRSGSATSSTPRPSRPTRRAARALPAIRGDISVRARHLPLPHRRPGGAARRQLRRAGRADGRHRRAVGLGQEHARQARPAPLRAGKRARAGRRHRSRHGRPGLAAPPDRRRAAGERAVQPLGARQHRARRSGHADGARHRGGEARRRARFHPRAAAKATTRSSASAARACRAASASASPSPARWSPTRAS